MEDDVRNLGRSANHRQAALSIINISNSNANGKRLEFYIEAEFYMGGMAFRIIGRPMGSNYFQYKGLLKWHSNQAPGLPLIDKYFAS